MNLTNYEFYNNGTPGASAVVGVSDRLPRNVRYTFTAPATGASGVSLRFQGSAGSGTTPDRLRFAFTTDPTAYAAANWNTQGNGVITRISGGYAYEGTASVLLLPGLTYYLFIWPDTSTFGWVWWYTADGYSTLETTGGAYSSLTVPNGTLGSPITLKVTRYDTTFSHRVTYSFGKETGQIYEGKAESFSWTPPLSLASQIPAASSANAVYSITTFDGSGNQVGTPQAVTASLDVPDSVVPTVTFTWEDPTGKASVFGDPVQNVSALKVTPTAAGAYGSTITATTVKLNGANYSGGIVTASGSLTLSVTVTDSRGRTATAEQTVNVIAYQAPQLTLSASRCTQDGTLDDEGEYALITVTGSLALIGGQNSGALTVTYAAGDGGASYEKTEDPVTPANYFWYEWVVEAPSENTLEISATVQDRITTARRTMTLSVGYATLDFLAGGKGIAFGTTAKAEGFTCAMNANFTGGLQLGSKALVDVIYPVGSIYMSANNVSPAAFLGGTWERIENRFLLAAGSSYAAGATGGEATHTLTESEMPAHAHKTLSGGGYSTRFADGNGTVYGISPSANITAYTPYTTATGGGQAHNNMPPYLAVYIWKRTA